jgi:hypothetical protein
MNSIKSTFRTLSIAAAILAITGCNDDNWSKIEGLKAPDQTFKVKVSTDTRLHVGETLEFDVTSEKSGKLWLVHVGPEDEITLLFPNDIDSDNEIESGETIHVPAEGEKWFVEAAEPAGKNIVATIVTTGNTSINDVVDAIEEKNEAKALHLISNAAAWGINKQVIEVLSND